MRMLYTIHIYRNDIRCAEINLKTTTMTTVTATDGASISSNQPH